jgi:hypothetical protein
MEMKVFKTNVPIYSFLRHTHQKIDYQDCFQASFIDKQSWATPTGTCKAFLLSVRELVQKLLNRRDKMASLFAFKKEKTRKMQELTSFKYETGEQLGFLKVFYRNNNEIILGANHRHFDFRISLLLEDAKPSGKRSLNFSTGVIFNNRWGRIYFLFIKPLHKLMARRLIKSIVKKLESSNNNV